MITLFSVMLSNSILTIFTEYNTFFGEVEMFVAVCYDPG